MAPRASSVHAIIHGCRIGARSVVEPGAIVCDGSVVGAGCVVRAGAVVKQRSRFAAGTDIDGFPAVDVGRIPESPQPPVWALRHDDLPIPAPRGPRR
jgi:carbonic anhydrase/acetyltransferase-like protein (isoleucine patch superfamily)